MHWQSCFQSGLSRHANVLEICTSNAHEIVHLCSSLSTLLVVMVDDGAKGANLITILVISVDALVEHLKLFFVFFVSGVLVAIGGRQ